MIEVFFTVLFYKFWIKLMYVKKYFLEMPEYAGFFRKMPVNASGMDFTHKCRHFPNPAFSPDVFSLNTTGNVLGNYPPC